MKLLRLVGTGFVGLLVVSSLTAVAARMSDGPIGPFAGGPLIAGPMMPGEPDWRRLPPSGVGEFQLLTPSRSRTVGYVVYEGELFIPCYFPSFRLWKQWPYEAVLDGRSVLRIEGKRYPVSAERVTNPDVFDPVWERMTLDLGAPGKDSVWIFRISSRSKAG